MKLLLDENLPKKSKNELSGHQVLTVSEMGWNGKENGELLDLLIQNEFDVFLTGDKNLQHQQNFKKYTIPVFLLNAFFITYPELKPLIPIVLQKLETNPGPGPHIISPKKEGAE